MHEFDFNFEFEFAPKIGFANLAGEWVEAILKNGPTVGLFNFQQVEYSLYLPKNRPHKHLPLLVMIHGCGQSANSFAAGSRFNEYAERYGFAVLYPYQNNFRNMNNCWHWFNVNGRHSLEEKNSVVQIVSALLHSCEFLDPERVYLGGISSGAALAGVIAMDYSYLFAGLALHSCPMFLEARNAATAIRIMKDGYSNDINDLPVPISYVENPLPVMIIHGEKDDYVNPINASQLQRWFTQLNRKAARILSERAKPVRVKIVSGLWHGWSNGDPEIRYNEASDYDASREILKFFQLNKI